MIKHHLKCPKFETLNLPSPSGLIRGLSRIQILRTLSHRLGRHFQEALSALYSQCSHCILNRYPIDSYCIKS